MSYDKWTAEVYRVIDMMRQRYLTTTMSPHAMTWYGTPRLPEPLYRSICLHCGGRRGDERSCPGCGSHETK